MQTSTIAAMLLIVNFTELNEYIFRYNFYSMILPAILTASIGTLFIRWMHYRKHEKEKLEHIALHEKERLEHQLTHDKEIADILKTIETTKIDSLAIWETFMDEQKKISENIDIIRQELSKPIDIHNRMYLKLEEAIDYSHITELFTKEDIKDITDYLSTKTETVYNTLQNVLKFNIEKTEIKIIENIILSVKNIFTQTSKNIMGDNFTFVNKNECEPMFNDHLLKLKIIIDDKLKNNKRERIIKQFESFLFESLTKSINVFINMNSIKKEVVMIEIPKLLSKNKYEDALRKLPGNNINVIMINSKFYNLKEQKIRGTISDKDYNLEISKLSEGILTLINDETLYSNNT